ncbi:hypothetical protein HMI54_004707, partial [Coelomomyces lativittatus]
MNRTTNGLQTNFSTTPTSNHLFPTPSPTSLSHSPPLDPTDPFLISSSSKGSTSQFERYRKTTEELSVLRKRRGTQAKKVFQFYQHQNEVIDDFLRPLDSSSGTMLDDLGESKKITFAIRASLGVNVLLFCLQAAAAIFSQSLSLFATATDSFMDLFSGIILVLADWTSSKQNILDYPTGKKRYQTVGLICFASVMFMASIELL